MFSHELSSSRAVFCELIGATPTLSLTTLTPVRLVKDTWSINSQNRETTRGRGPSVRAAGCEANVFFLRVGTVTVVVPLAYLCELFATHGIPHDSH